MKNNNYVIMEPLYNMKRLLLYIYMSFEILLCVIENVEFKLQLLYIFKGIFF